MNENTSYFQWKVTHVVIMFTHKLVERLIDPLTCKIKRVDVGQLNHVSFTFANLMSVI